MRSNAHTPSSSTRPRRGRTADVADTRRRHQPPADPRPAPSNTAARTANSPGILAWALSGRQSETTTSHEHHTHGETPKDPPDQPDRATSRNRSGNPGEGMRLGEALGLRI